MTLIAGLPAMGGSGVILAGSAFGEAVEAVYGWDDDAVTAVARPLGVLLVLCSIMAMVRLAPHRRHPGWSWLVIGNEPAQGGETGHVVTQLADHDRPPGGVDDRHRQGVLVTVDPCKPPDLRSSRLGRYRAERRHFKGLRDGVLTPLSSVTCPDTTAAGRHPLRRPQPAGRAARGRAFPTAARTPSKPGQDSSNLK
ncbi:hypothetical protein [Geodermatophilus normandii]|nr:hypothetical protein [Geodermatophilus normandii]